MDFLDLWDATFSGSPTHENETIKAIARRFYEAGFIACAESEAGKQLVGVAYDRGSDDGPP